MSRTQVNTRVATLDESVILDDKKFQDELATLAQEIGLSQEQAEERARKCLEELAVRPEERYLGWVEKLARFMTSRSYDAQLDVNTDKLEELKELSKTNPLVFLWSHKSHLDSFVFM